MHLNMSSVKWRPFCPGGDELMMPRSSADFMVPHNQTCHGIMYNGPVIMYNEQVIIHNGPVIMYNEQVIIHNGPVIMYNEQVIIHNGPVIMSQCFPSVVALNLHCMSLSV